MVQEDLDILLITTASVFANAADITTGSATLHSVNYDSAFSASASASGAVVTASVAIAALDGQYDADST